MGIPADPGPGNLILQVSLNGELSPHGLVLGITQSLGLGRGHFGWAHMDIEVAAGT